MWPEKKDELAERMKAVNACAEKYNRTLDYGLRVHVIVRDTEQEAREYAAEIVSKLDDDLDSKIRNRAQDSTSLGISLQAKNREHANNSGCVEPHLWTGVGRARKWALARLSSPATRILMNVNRSASECYHH